MGNNGTPDLPGDLRIRQTTDAHADSPQIADQPNTFTSQGTGSHCRLSSRKTPIGSLFSGFFEAAGGSQAYP